MEPEDRWITLTNIKRWTQIAIRKEHTDLGLSGIDSSRYEADFYFDRPLETKAGGALSDENSVYTGKANLVFETGENQYRAILYLRESWVYGTIQRIDAELTISLPTEAEEFFVGCNGGEQTLRAIFRSGTWERDYGIHNFGTIEEVNLNQSAGAASKLLDEARKEEIENFLLQNICGGQADGQMPAVCRELAPLLLQAMGVDDEYKNEEWLFDLLTSLRWINLGGDDELRDKINKELGGAAYNLHTEYGNALREKLSDINDQKLKARFLDAYNRIYIPQDPHDVVGRNHNFNEHTLHASVDLYTSNRKFHSKHLNRIFLEALLIYEIRRKADSYLHDSVMSREALDCVKMQVYDADRIKIIGKKGLKLYLSGLGSLLEALALFAAVGFVSWGLATLLSDENEMAQYILFASFLSTWFILRRLNRRDPVNANKDNEEKGFYVLKDLCNLHNKVAAEDATLLRSLMINLELRGVSFDDRIYKIMRKIERN
jgi:hypothetical protein